MADFNQDDERERYMRIACQILEPVTQSRYGEDGYLDVEVDGKQHHLLFELKSAPAGKSFGTGRDTGLQQLQRYSEMHFIFAQMPPKVQKIERLWYGAPSMMREWVENERDYLELDLKLIEGLWQILDDELMEQLLTHTLGTASVFSYDEIKRFQKAQWQRHKPSGREDKYRSRAMQPVPRKAADRRYDRHAAALGVKERLEYLLGRGATVNNRKISLSYVKKNCVELAPKRAGRSLEAAIEDAIRGT